jgi:CubicO group peptidase (beta-lactamase class C family)
VLGQLVEAVSGQSLDDFMRARIFVPLGMHDTSYATPVTDTGRVATTHARGEQGLVETPNPAAVTSPDNGDGGLNSTAADYARFIQLFLNGGRGPDGARLLKRGTVRRMGRPQTGNVYVELQPAAIPNLTRPFPLGAGRDRYGLGFQVTGEHDADGMRSAGSLSWAGIFNTEFWIDTERGIGAVLLMQYLPFYDEAAIETLQGFEKRVYATF